MHITTIRERAYCYWCATISHILDNPYQFGAAVFAKLAVNAATMIFFGVVLIKDNAFAKWPGREFLPADPAAENIAENFVAAIVIAVASYAVYRLVRKRPPAWFGVVYYALTALVWLYVWVTLLIAITEGTTDVRPGQLAGISTITGIALFAFISNPKRAGGGADRDGSHPIL